MKTGMQLISIWFGAIMIIVVLAGAVAFAFTDLMSESLYGTKRTTFVFLLLAYGAYRGFRLYSILKK